MEFMFSFSLVLLLVHRNLLIVSCHIALVILLDSFCTVIGSLVCNIKRFANRDVLFLCLLFSFNFLLVLY